MLDVSENFKNKSTSASTCPVCMDGDSVDSQQHLMVCKQLSDNELVQNQPMYCDLFSMDTEKENSISGIIQNRFRKRKKMMKN